MGAGGIGNLNSLHVKLFCCVPKKTQFCQVINENIVATIKMIIQCTTHESKAFCVFKTNSYLNFIIRLLFSHNLNGLLILFLSVSGNREYLF